MITPGPTFSAGRTSPVGSALRWGPADSSSSSEGQYRSHNDPADTGPFERAFASLPSHSRVSHPCPHAPYLMSAEEFCDRKDHARGQVQLRSVDGRLAGP